MVATRRKRGAERRRHNALVITFAREGSGAREGRYQVMGESSDAAARQERAADDIHRTHRDEE